MKAVIQLTDGTNTMMFYGSEHEDSWGDFCYNINQAYIFGSVDEANRFIRSMQERIGFPPCWKTAQVKGVSIVINK